MKVLLLTVAGLSARFGKSVGRECLKCIYFEKDFKQSLLWQAVNKNKSFDKIIIVGGFKFEELKSFTEKYFADISDKIVLVKNERYADYGSGYSLYKGLEKAVLFAPEQILFAEGDLWVDDLSFNRLVDSKKDCVTYNGEIIKADKSVVFYYDSFGKIHYLYDVTHNLLEIKEPFASIYNSGQMWKFNNLNIVKSTLESLTDKEWQGTNLVFVQRYFENLKDGEYDLVQLKRWINCNTVDDFRKTGIDK